MKQNCDLCKVSSTSSSPPLSKPGKMKVALEEEEKGGHKKREEKSMKSTKYLMSTKHCSESPPLKPVASSLIRTIPPSSQAAAAVAQAELGHQQQLPYHHLHPPHHQFNGFDEYYSAPLLSPSLMMDMMLAAHLLRG